ncbi:Hypothetical predicted protein, partial [Drosophila guanche]
RTNRTPIDWEKVPFVPRPSLISDPVTAFGVRRAEHEQRKRFILDPINKAAIKPNYKIAYEPIEPYVSTRDKNRTRILSLVRQHIDTVEAGGNTAARTSRDSLDSQLPRLHRAASESLPTPRLDLCTDRPGSHRTRASSDYSYNAKSTVQNSSYDSSNPYSRPERSTYSSTVEKTSRSGPGGSYNYSTERTSTTGAGPGGYSYSSTTSGNLPGGTKYRHFSYH